MNFEPIGFAETDFKEKFGIPRQPGLVRTARGTIRLEKKFAPAVRGLEGFSHIWLIWVFHDVNVYKPVIRPPRLGGAKKIGVLASRSPHRPNPIGLSVVKLEQVRQTSKYVELDVRGVDLLDGTPILDIKPYVPYADRARNAKAGWASDPIRLKPVRFSKAARMQIASIEKNGRPDFKKFVQDFLAHDPRPAFQQKNMKDGSRFGVRIGKWDVQFEVRKGGFWVRELV